MARQSGSLVNLDAKERETAALLDRKVAACRVFLAIDDIFTAIWPFAATIAFFFAASWMGVWAAAPDWLRLLLLACFGLATAYALWRIIKGPLWPTRQEARLRLDQPFEDRPIAAFDEIIAVGAEKDDPEKLWAAHKRRVIERARDVKATLPAFSVRGSDPFGIRLFAALALVVALIFGQGGSWRDAAAPLTTAPPTPVILPSMEAWATPPRYTGAVPIYLSEAPARISHYKTPEGTVLSIRIFDTVRAPTLRVEPADAVGPVPPEDVDGEPIPAEIRPASTEHDGAYLADLVLLKSARISLALPGVSGQALDLDFNVTADRPPEMALETAPERSGEGEMAFTFRGADDYGITRAWAALSLDEEKTRRGSEGPVSATPAEPYIFDMPTPTTRLREIDQALEAEPLDPTQAAIRKAELLGAPVTAAHNFNGHAWVTLPVKMVLHAEDAKGQTAQTEPIRFLLPGRLFSEPMAKALIEQRASVSWNIKMGPRAHRFLAALTRYPDDYFNKTTDYLTVKFAIERLARALTDAALDQQKEDVMAALYAAAVKLEDAGLENALARLQRAQRRLREALENGAADEEIAALMAALRAAIDDYLQALSELAERNPERAEQMMRELGENSQTLGGAQLEEMLKQLEEAARGGQREQAEEMLSMLSDLLQNLLPGGQTAQDGTIPGQRQQGGGEGERSLGALRDIIEQEQRQAEDSYEANRRRDAQNRGRQGPRQGQGQGQGQSGQGSEQQAGDGANPNDGRALDSESLRQRQEALRRRLGELRRSFGDQLADGLNQPGLSAESRERLAQSREQTLRSFDQAEESMRRAEDALSQDEPGAATDDQMAAIDELRDAWRNSREGLMYQDQIARGENPEQQPDPQANGRRMSRDPFGREQAGIEELGRGDAQRSGAQNRSPDDGSLRDGSLPDGFLPGGLHATPRERARRILENLTRRLGQRTRPPEERDYLQRLLDRF